MKLIDVLAIVFNLATIVAAILGLALVLTEAPSLQWPAAFVVVVMISAAAEYFSEQSRLQRLELEERRRNERETIHG